MAGMRRAWESFASDDAMFFIATEDRRFTRSWTAAEFFELGGQEVADILGWVGSRAHPGRLLEIGCGLGRHTVHLAARFEHVDAVDISPSMIEQARGLGMPSNVELAVCSGRDLSGFPDGGHDVVYSCLVFQHIPDEAVIASYLKETVRVLSPGGRALLQFDSRPSGPATTLRELAPDWLLPRSYRRFVRRYRRPPQRLRELVETSGLTVQDERGAGTEAHQMLLAPRAR